MAVPFQIRMLRDMRDELAGSAKRTEPKPDGRAMLRNMDELAQKAQRCIGFEYQYGVGASQKDRSYITVQCTIIMKVRRQHGMRLGLAEKLDEILAAAEYGHPEC